MLYSPFATWSDEVYGKLTPPNSVTNFSMVAQGDQAHLSWDGVPDLDVIHGGTYWIRYTSSSSGSWASSSDITKTIPGNTNNYSVPLMSGTYLIKALDSSGNESETAAQVISNVADILDLNAVYTSTQHSDFGNSTADKGVNDSDTTNIYYDQTNQTIQLATDTVASGTHDAYYNTGSHEDDIVSSGTHDDARSTGTHNEYIASGTHDNLGSGAHEDVRAYGTHNAILNAGSVEYITDNVFDTAAGNFDARSGNFDDIIHTTNKLEDDNASFDASWLNNIIRNTTDNTTATVTNVDSSTRLTLSADIFDGASGDAYRLETKVNQLRDTSANFTAADIGRTIRNTTDGGTATITTVHSTSLVTLSTGLFTNDHGDGWELEAGPGYLRDTSASFSISLVGRTVRNTNDGTTATVSTFVNSSEITLSSGIFDNKNGHSYEVEAGSSKLYDNSASFTSSMVGNIVRNTSAGTSTTVSAYVSSNELTLTSGIFDNKEGNTYTINNELNRLRDTSANFTTADVGRTVRNNTDNTVTTIASRLSSTEVTLTSGIFDDQHGDTWEIEAGPNSLRDTGASFTSALVGRTVRNTNDATTATVSAFVSSNELTLSSGIFDNKDGHVYEMEPGYDRLYDPTANFSTEVVGKLVRNLSDGTSATISSRVSSTELVLSSPIFDNQDGDNYRIEVQDYRLRDTGASFSSSDDNRIIRNLDTGVLSTVASVENSTTLVLEDDIFGQTDAANYKIEGDVKDAGYYYFTDQKYDLGQVYTSRITTNYASSSFSTTSLFDGSSGLFDSASGRFDGTDISDTNASLEISTTSNDPTSGSASWSTWTPFFVGDYIARGVRFRLKLTSNNTTHNIRLNELSATIDMPDTIKRATGITTNSGTNNGTSVITYDNPFKTTPTVGITMQDSNTGDYYTITSASTTGFTVTFYNSGATATQRTFNWMSTGY